jgi:P-type Cu+ transporter
LAKDPVCGMFVEEKHDTIIIIKDGRKYFFCSSQCLNEFTQPEKELRKLIRLVAISIGLTIPIVILSLPHMFPSQFDTLIPMHIMQYTNFIMLALATPLQFWIGWRFYRGLWDGIRARASNMDTLIAVGTTTAYVYSAIVTLAPNYLPFKSVYFETAAIIITLILIGRLLETRTKEKASDAVRKLLDLQPKMAKILRNGTELDLPIEQVKENDLMLIKAGERIPADGIVEDGLSSVDESAITGESIPVDKHEGDQVIGATINKNGLLKVRATKVGQDTVLSQIITLVEQARTGKAKMQRLVDQVAKYFVPGVIIIAVCVGVGWYYVGGIGLTYSILAFVSVIIIACPCALGIATPAALMMGSGKAAENGILFKGGEYLEIARKVKTLVFDKTGTLTKGKPTVTDIINLTDNSFSEAELLRMAAIAESGSEHPLSQAVIIKANEKGLPAVSSAPDSFEAVSGHGLRATYADHTILIGNRKLIEDNNLSVTSTVESKLKELESEGKTATLIAIDNNISGIIAFADTIKDEAGEVIDSLKLMGIDVVMLTGDNERTAKSVAYQLGISKVFSQVLPQQKEKVISNLKINGNVVAMVGDGINDAPALAQADLGIAIGSGTDIAKETGGIILIKGDLRDVITALDLGKKTVIKIKQNLFWAFVYNTGLIPIAGGILVPFTGVGIFGWLPMLAGLAMAMSSVTVVGNSILLGRYKPRFKKEYKEQTQMKSFDTIRTLPAGR